MPGSSLKYSMSPEIPRRILKLLGFRGQGAKIPRQARFSNICKMCYAAGAPQSNSSDWAPGDSTGSLAIGTLCLDETNDDVYVCSAWTDVSTHTWTKITP